MSLFEEWKKDMKFIYIAINFYIEPRFKVTEVSKVYEHELNSHGVWGVEENGVMHLWINLEIYSTAVDFNNRPITYDDKNILAAFNYDKQRWIISKRKEKIQKLKLFQNDNV